MIATFYKKYKSLITAWWVDQDKVKVAIFTPVMIVILNVYPSSYGKILVSIFFMIYVNEKMEMWYAEISVKLKKRKADKQREKDNRNLH